LVVTSAPGAARSTDSRIAVAEHDVVADFGGIHRVDGQAFSSAQSQQIAGELRCAQRTQTVYCQRHATGAEDAIPGHHQRGACEHVDAEALIVLDPVVAQLDGAGERIRAAERGTNAEHDLVDGHGAIAVCVGGVAVVERATLQRDADHRHQFVDGDVHVLVAVAGGRHAQRDAADLVVREFVVRGDDPRHTPDDQAAVQAVRGGVVRDRRHLGADHRQPRTCAVQ
jgi:hypothetical protein